MVGTWRFAFGGRIGSYEFTFQGQRANDAATDAWSSVMVLWVRLVYSSATQRTNSPPNMSLLFSTTMQSL